MEFDLNGVKYPKTFGGEYLWPNELSTYTDTAGCKVMLIPDGFLTPGQNDGAIYAIRDPNNMNSDCPSEQASLHRRGGGAGLVEYS
jgi:hypothetical protein